MTVLERGGDDPASRTGYQFATLHAGDTVKVDYGGPFLNGLVIGGLVDGNVVFTAAVVQQRVTPLDNALNTHSTVNLAYAGGGIAITGTG